MEGQWLQELLLRLQEEENYLLWKKGVENIQEYLMTDLTERQRDLLADLLSALQMVRTYELDYAYEIGTEYGRAEAAQKEPAAN